MDPLQEIIIDKEIKDSFRIKKFSNAEAQPISALYHRIFFIVRGKGILNTDNHSVPFNNASILLVSKGQVFSLSNTSTLSGFEISFGDCFWERTPGSASNCKAILFNNTHPHQLIKADEKSTQSLLPVFELLLNENNTEDFPNKLDSMAAYLKIIMIKLANLHTHAELQLNDYDNQLYNQFLELVNTHYSKTHKVEDFAKDLSVSPRKLSDLCRTKSGIGAKEIINNKLIGEAKRRLQFTAKPIKEIAYALSFATPEQFSHFFKKNTKLAPADFRNQFVNIGR